MLFFSKILKYVFFNMPMVQFTHICVYVYLFFISFLH